MSCGVGQRCSSDPILLWLWRRPSATALIQPLAWVPPYAVGAAQEMAKSQKKKKIVISFSSGIYPEVELLDHVIVLFLIF